MNKIKTLIILALMFFSGTSFAAWSQPTEVPPGGNTEPPINVGTSDQIKKAMIGATKFCIYDSAGAEVSCTQSFTPGGSSFWSKISTTPNIKNENTGNVFINEAKAKNNWKNLFEKLTVGGKVKAEGFCLGDSCISITPGVGDTVNNWAVEIKKILSFPQAACSDGQVLKYQKPAGSTAGSWVCSSSETGFWESEEKTLSNGVVYEYIENKNPGGNVLIKEILEAGSLLVNKTANVLGVTNTRGGLIIEKKTKAQTQADLPTMEEGRLWLVTDL